LSAQQVLDVHFDARTTQVIDQTVTYVADDASPEIARPL